MTTPIPRQTFKLYSEECMTLLDQACAQQANDNEQQTVNETTPFPLGYEFFDVPDSAAEDHELQEESDASSSSEESSSLPVEDPDQAPDESQQGTAATPVATTTESLVPSVPTPAIKPPKASAKQANQRQLEQQIQQHIQLLNHHPVPLDDQSALYIPTTLIHSQEHLTWTRDLARNLQTQPLVVLLLRSGRFAGAVFQQDTCVHHTTSTRYTVRKGQGKAQSSQDAQRRPKSMGSQLRRAGEQALKQDIQQTLEQWKSILANAALILISAPKTMRATLFETHLDKKDSRIRNIPLDVGRPTMEATRIVQAAIMTVWVGPWEAPTGPVVSTEEEKALASANESNPPPNGGPLETPTQDSDKTAEILPLTDLHLAARDGNLPRLLDLLRDPVQITNVNGAAGYDFMTPLHFASEAQADACVSALLVQGQADPTRLDARRRVPYFLATTDKTREAFRTARAILGEDAHDWDSAKVGPPLTEQEIQLRKEKEAEKKRRKKAKQKEKKSKDKSHEEEMEQRRQEQLAQQLAEEEAKRIRDALPPKQRGGGENVCDFCQTEVKGRKRQQMLHRLDYHYCSTECVQKHKRELMAKAAMERFQ